MLMFAVGVAATGIAHQAGWLIASRRRLVEIRPVLDGVGSTRPSDQRLHDIAFNASMFCVRSSDLAEPHFDEPSPARSWQTRLLPYFDFPSRLGGELDDTRPWNDPANSAYFRGVVPSFLNPEVGVVRSPEGYALSHYAGNVHVLGTTASTRASWPPAGRTRSSQARWRRGSSHGATPQTSLTRAGVLTNRRRGSAARAVSRPISGSPMVPSGHSARRLTPRSSGG